MNGSATTPSRTSVWSLAGALLLLAAALGAQALRERWFPTYGGTAHAIYLTSPAAVGRAVLSFDAIAADIYWIRAIQHFGDTRLGRTPDGTYALLRPLLELATGLDPRFTVAYRFGAIFLAEAPPDGPGRPDWSIALLQKGMAAVPDYWQLAMDTGFVHYWWMRDYRTAADWFARAADMKGAPWWLRSLAATTLAEGGDRASSRRMWQRLFEQADHDWLRNNARLRLLQLDALDQMDALDAMAARFAAASGREADSWDDLLRAGWLQTVPADPSGVPYRLQRRHEGGVALDPTSALLPLPPQLHKKGRPLP